MQFTERKKVIVKKHFKLYKDLACFEQRERNTHYIHVNDFLKLFVFGNADDCSVFFPRFFPQFTPCFSTSLFVILLTFFPHLKKIENENYLHQGLQHAYTYLHKVKIVYWIQKGHQFV